jgi:hypothetical protein
MKPPFRSGPVATAPSTAAIASAGRVAALAAAADATKPNFKGTAKRPFAHKVKSNKTTPLAGYRYGREFFYRSVLELDGR